MDQFATGLVGTRSPEPWGPCRNAFDPEVISGGSSAGSAGSGSIGPGELCTGHGYRGFGESASYVE
jgi:allophanate hydrolase